MRRLAGRAVVVAVVVALVAAGTGHAGASGASGAATPAVRGPVLDGDWPDPELVGDAASGRWFTFATNFTVFGFQFNVPVRSSADLAGWSTFHGDALPTLPAWAAAGHTWAPGVARIAGRWVLFFTAEHEASGRQCIGVATASAPAGPYAPTSDVPLVCQLDLGGSIDASPFLDPAAGRWWLHWKSEENAIGRPSRLWAAPLTADGLAIAGPATPVLRADEPVEEGVVEAPDMEYAAGRYWLFHAGAHWATSGYFGHWSACDGPAGPCRQEVDPVDPLLGPGSGAVGPGAMSLARIDGTRWAAVFHGWRGGVGYGGGANRALHLEPVTFDGPGGRPRLRPDLPRTGGPPVAEVPPDFASGPSAAGAGVARVEAWRSPDGGISYRVGGGATFDAGGLTALRPDVARGPDVGIVVAATGTDGAVWLWIDRAWRSLGGSTAFSPTVAAWGGERLDVMATGSDAGLWHRWSNDGGATWAPWSPLGGHLTSGPDLAAWAPDRLDVVVRGTDGAVWQRAWTPGWTGWVPLGGAVVGAPAIASAGPGSLDLVVRGIDDQVWHRRWTPGWTAWSPLAGFTADEPALAGGGGALGITVRGTDQRPWHRDRTSPGVAFGGWYVSGA